MGAFAERPRKATLDTVLTLGTLGAVGAGVNPKTTKHP